MKTIEERASSFATNDGKIVKCSAYECMCLHNGYIVGAEEQQAIDEEFHTSEVLRIEKEHKEEIDKLKDMYIKVFKEVCEKWQKVYLHKATSPSPYSRKVAPEQFVAVNNVLVEVLKEFGVYPEEEEEE